MIITFLSVTALTISLSAGQMDPAYLSDYIEPICYDHKDNLLLINGQEVPLAHTLENFIYLVEKFERANPDLKLRDEVFLLLRNFTSENLVTGLVPWIPEGSDYQLYAQNLWEHREAVRTFIPAHIDPFSDDEKCSLFFMLSHTVNDTARSVLDDAYMRSYVTQKTVGIMRSEVKKSKFPREQGVVAIQMTTHAVALSRVVLGIYLGLNKDRKQKLLDVIGKKFESVQSDNKDNLILDPLYALTIADMITLTQWPSSSRKKEYGGNGVWRSVVFDSNINTDDICPNVYELPENETGPFTYSSIRGGIDGLIIGSMIEKISHDSADQVKLSQVLRMYYSQHGLPEQTAIPVSNAPASFCHRADRIGPLTDQLKEQIEIYTLVITQKYKDISNFVSSAWNYFESKKADIFSLGQELQAFCANPPSLDNSADLPCETMSDVIAVMDTTVSADQVNQQQLILGYLANYANVQIGGSTITILLDQQNTSSGSGLTLTSLVSNTSSSACAACHVVHYDSNKSGGRATRITVIQSVDKLLDERNRLESKFNAAPGRVVILFNYANDETEPAYRLEKVIQDLHTRHLDIPIFTVGVNPVVMRKYARNNEHNVIQANGDPKKIAHTLSKKICEEPAQLQYEDCKEGTNEAGAVFEGLVTPNTVQHWAMMPEYFLKSYNPKVSFETFDSNIRVCHTRSRSRPEVNAKNCQTTNATSRRIVVDEYRNPCKGFNVVNCPPFFFSVIGVEEKNREIKYCQDTKDEKCKTLDQIKFKVSHEGIRCSGCVGLLSSPFSLLLLFVFYLFHSKYC